MKLKSYAMIDYKTRARKFVERKMIKELCQRLSAFDELINYQYIGFGSLPYVDFKLIHQELGIDKMVSIEAEDDESIQSRFEFNKPYHFIDMIFEKSTQALYKINFSVRSIIWLDYDENIQPYMFDDLKILLDKCISGSVIIISLNSSINPDCKVPVLEKIKEFKSKYTTLINLGVDDGKLKDEIRQILVDLVEDKVLPNQRLDIISKLIEELNNVQMISLGKEYNRMLDELQELRIMLDTPDQLQPKPYRVERFKQEFSNYLTRSTIKEKDLLNKEAPKIIKEMFDSQISDSLTHRNQGGQNPLMYEQLINFIYKDNAPMMTFGGIIYSNEEEEQYKKANFDCLEFTRKNNEPYSIDIPPLTRKEMLYLDNMPLSSLEEIASTEEEGKKQSNKPKIEYLDHKAIEEYRRLHRYLPNFSHVETV